MKKKQVRKKLNNPLENLPRVAWKRIDSKSAEEMLKLLTINRKLQSSHVSFLTREMREGRWRINGDTIRFSAKRLLDGQHRLHAVIQSGITITVLVVEELEDEAYDSIDTGRVRGAGDVLSTMGFGSNPFMAAAAARFLWYHDNGVSLDSSIRISNHQIIETARRNPFIQFVSDYLGTKKNMRASPIVTALVLIARVSSQEMAMFFAEKLVLGAELKADDPIRFFRDKWLSESRHRSSRGDRAAWIAICIKTFNAWQSGKKVTMAERWSSNEKFPEVQKKS